MSTLKSNNEDMTINADGASSEIILQQNGTEIGRIGSGFAGTSGQVLTSNGAGSAPTMQAGGKVLQVQSETKTDTFTTTSSTWTDITGLSVSLTPSATSSEILVRFNISVANSSANHNAIVRLVRGSTAIAVGDTAGDRSRASGASRNASVAERGVISVEIKDAPSTTSAITYKLQMWTESGTAVVNRTGNDIDVNYHARVASSITVMEIGA